MPAYTGREQGVQMINDALSGFQDRSARRSAAEEQAKAAQDQAKKQYLVALMQKLPPGDLQAFMAANKDQLNGVNLPAHQVTPDETFQGMVTDSNIKTFPTLPQSVRQGITGRAASGADLPASQIDLLNSQDVTSNPDKWSGAVQQKQAIHDKRSLDAGQVQSGQQDARDFSQIKLPESKQKIAGEKATEASTYATAGKTREATRGEKIGNDMLGGVAGAAPGTGASPIAQSLAERKYDPKLLRGLLSKNPGAAQALEAQVRQIDPNFSMADYESYVKTKKDYASGPQAQSLVSLNTAIRHINSLYDDFQKMGNSDYPGYNAGANWLAEQTGDKKVQHAKAKVKEDAQLVATEITKAVRGSGAMSEKEVALQLKGLSENSAPEAMKGTIEAALQLLGGRYAELVEGYQRGVGRPVDREWIGAGTKNILNRFAKVGVGGTGDLLGGGQAGAPAPGAAPTGKTVTRADLQKMGSNEQEAQANGYTVVP